jgi:hypothetical protein
MPRLQRFTTFHVTRIASMYGRQLSSHQADANPIQTLRIHVKTQPHNRQETFNTTMPAK